MEKDAAGCRALNRNYYCRRFFQSPDEPTELDTYQQMLATDKLLEYAEISLRTVCDLIRYQQLKELGVVHSAKEFIQLFHPDEQEDTP